MQRAKRSVERPSSSIRQAGSQVRSLGTARAGRAPAAADAVAFMIGGETAEDHDTTTLSRDEGRRRWLYPGRPWEPGGQFISPTGHLSLLPGARVPEGTEDRGRRTARQAATTTCPVMMRTRPVQSCRVVPCRVLWRAVRCAALCCPVPCSPVLPGLFHQRRGRIGAFLSLIVLD